MVMSQDLNYGRPGMSPSRMVGLVLVILLHVGIIYALVTGLGEQLVQVVRGPLETKIIHEVKAQQKAVPPPPPTFKPPPPAYIPPPDIQIQSNAPATTAITVVTHQAAPPPPPPAPVQHAVVKPELATAGSCKPNYPDAARDAEEEGTGIVSFTVNPDGSASSPQVVKSTGYSDLDRALMNEVTTCQFTPGTIDGNAAAMQKLIKYTFQLDN